MLVRVDFDKNKTIQEENRLYSEAWGELVNSVSIKNYINEAYNTWTVPPSTILLAADQPLIPAPVWNSYCSSDNMYADVDDDNLPNIFISRIPFNSVSMLDSFVQRMISFDSDFHNCSDFIVPVTGLDVGLYFVKISDKKKVHSSKRLYFNKM